MRTHNYIPLEGEQGILNVLVSWYLLPLQAFWTALVTVLAVTWLDGRPFAIGTSNRYLEWADGPSLTQSDITTLISVFLTVSRIITGSWQSLSSWRCIFILLEKTGLRLGDVNWAASWKVPGLSMFASHKNRSKADLSFQWAICIIFLLLWPAQLANPIASGAVSWVPATRVNMTGTAQAVGAAHAGPNWLWYVTYSSARLQLVKQSAALAGSETSPFQSKNNTDTAFISPSQRMVSQFASYSNGSVVRNITVPSFKIDSFNWVSDLSMLPSGIYESIIQMEGTLLNITEDGGNPLGQTIPGTSALLKNTTWTAPSSSALPSPTVFIGKKYAAIYVNRYQNNGDIIKYPCSSASSDFDPLPPNVALVNQAWNNNYSDCIAVAEIGITVGVTDCRQDGSFTSSLSSPECALNSSIGIVTSSKNTVSPDHLTLEIFNMMPEVQALAAALSTTSTYLSGGLELYLRMSLIRSYQGTWSALTNYLSDDSVELDTEIYQPFKVVRAEVARWRIYLWAGINLLLVLAGLALAVIQATWSGISTVNDPALEAILLDSSRLHSSQGKPDNFRRLGTNQKEGFSSTVAKLRDWGPSVDLDGTIQGPHAGNVDHWLILERRDEETHLHPGGFLESSTELRNLVTE
ncbi:hypothetical protein N7466_010056 [Penicillium verhagenii]|uniref:uncharacterized protein n=1 Tax=Penicillium verhagenii TaxID=1562060 RepID=UPI0025452CBB|nr:uncharacterized protein N7466_010056 [Penicillium verhagenii]KAJ5919113.1 hypothetical protein N7466_010056 [Penicillium verhagenii]